MRPTTNRKLASCVLLLLLRKLKATDPIWRAFNSGVREMNQPADQATSHGDTGHSTAMTARPRSLCSKL